MSPYLRDTKESAMNSKKIIILSFVGGALLFWFICGILFLARGKVQEHIERQKEACTELTDATIIEMNKTRKRINGEYRNRWNPIYEYYVDGVRYEKESSNYYKYGVFEEGDQVDLYYNPDDPEEIYIPAEKPEDTVTLLMILAVAFFLAGFLVLGIMFPVVKNN